MGVAIELGSEMGVVEQELEPLLRVVVTEIGKRGTGCPAARFRILEPRRVDGDDRCDRVRRGRYRPGRIENNSCDFEMRKNLFDISTNI